MADQQQVAPGGHYSGKNKIPTINEFLSKLDRDKGDRDRQIDEQNKAARAANAGRGGAVPHQNQPVKPSKDQQTVTDPTTGNQVVIEDVNKDMMNAAKNPVVRKSDISCSLS